MSRTVPPSPSEAGVNGQQTNSHPVHRDDDGELRGIAVVLSPDQLIDLGIPDSATRVRPVVRGGVVHIEPAD